MRICVKAPSFLIKTLRALPSVSHPLSFTESGTKNFIAENCVFRSPKLIYLPSHEMRWQPGSSAGNPCGVWGRAPRFSALLFNSSGYTCLPVPPARGQLFPWGEGCASIVTEEILRRFRETGYPGCFLYVLQENDRARRFYEKHGFAWDGHSLEVTLTQDTVLTDLRYCRKF